MPFPENLNKIPKIIFITDFDSTITLRDSVVNHCLQIMTHTFGQRPHGQPMTL